MPWRRKALTDVTRDTERVKVHSWLILSGAVCLLLFPLLCLHTKANHRALVSMLLIGAVLYVTGFWLGVSSLLGLSE